MVIILAIETTKSVFSYQGGKKVSELLPPIWYSLTVYCYIYYTNPLNMLCQWRGIKGLTVYVE